MAAAAIGPRALAIGVVMAAVLVATPAQGAERPGAALVVPAGSLPVQIAADRRAVWVLGTDPAGRATLRPMSVRDGRPLGRSRVVGPTSESARLFAGPAIAWLVRERRGRVELSRLDVTAAGRRLHAITIPGSSIAAPVVAGGRAWTRAPAGLVRFEPRSGRPLARTVGGTPLALTDAALWTADLRAQARDDAPLGIAGTIARRDPRGGRTLAATAPISDRDPESLLDPRAEAGGLRGSASGRDLWLIGAGGAAARVTPDGALVRLAGTFADVALRGRSGYGLTRDGRRLLRYDAGSGLIVGRAPLRIGEPSRARIAVTHLGIWVTDPARRALVRVPHSAMR